MSNNKQSSIDFLIRQKAKYGIIINDDLRIAKAMHKKEIESSLRFGFNDGMRFFSPMYKSPYKYWDQYYNETFGGTNENL